MHTGLNDQGQEGQFLWASDFSGLEWANWENGQPDNHNGEDCVHLYGTRGFKWNDLTCTDTTHDSAGMHAVCQKSP